MKTTDRKLDVLFVSEKSLWPLDQGFRIRGSNMSQALIAQGLRVGTASIDCSDISNIPPDMRDRQIAWPDTDDQTHDAFMRAWSGNGSSLRQKLASHQGVDLQAMAGVRKLVQKHQPRVVVALGQHGPMLLRGVHDLNCQRIWYAADEPVRFQLSCMTKEPLRNWPERIRQMLFYAAMEAVFVRGVRGLDGAIAVSPIDAKLLKWLGGAKKTAMIRNGVDLDYFKPAPTPNHPAPASLVFWGRLDFEPNIDAVQWFAKEVWPALIQQRPEATWSIVGKFPHERLNEVAKLPGVTISQNVPDIRPFAYGASLTILPMRCGGGIKNKLLEAAAMSLPVVVSRRAIQGLELSADALPVHVAANAQAWTNDILSLWNDADRRQQLGQNARSWVTKDHSWSAAAAQFCDWANLSADEDSTSNQASNSAGAKTPTDFYYKEAA